MNEAAAGHDQANPAPPAAGSIDHNQAPSVGRRRAEHWLEAGTALMLAVVAISTAWSGYQARRWAGEQSTKYAEASTRRVETARESTLAGQWRLYDLNLVNNWIAAYSNGNTELALVYMRRFRPEFLPVFEAWLALDPFNDPNAPPGPLFMPQYQDTLGEKAAQLEAEASRKFDEGQKAKERGDAYVLDTVILAMVLFLAALGEHFQWRPIRAAILAIAFAMLLVGLYHLVSLPTV